MARSQTEKTIMKIASKRSLSRQVPRVFAVVCFALSPTLQAVVPPPDGGYPNFTTAEGTNALKNLTTGVGNTATGWHSLCVRRWTPSIGSLNKSQSIADLAELRDRGFVDFESLEGADRTRFNSYMHAVFRTVEDVYYQHLEGHLDQRVWRGIEVAVRELNATPRVQAWWRLRSHWFGGEEFAKLLISNSKQPPGMMTSSSIDEANSPICDAASACLPRRPAVAYLFLVRRWKNALRPFTARPAVAKLVAIRGLRRNGLGLSLACTFIEMNWY
jgi:hypothetical protein